MSMEVRLWNRDDGPAAHPCGARAYTVIPMFFGGSTRKLFAIYEAPSNGAAGRGVVICHPWGQEYLRAHGAMRLLATRLRNAGFHVLRFDYSGTGDSAGEFIDADVDDWCEDIETAVEELKDTAALHRVSLVGGRFGAVLASTAAGGRTDIDRLVLWDPITRPTDYLQGMVQAHRGGPPVELPSWQQEGTAPIDVNGFEVTPAMARGIASSRLDLGACESVRAVLMVATAHPLDHYSVLVDQFGQAAPVTSLESPGPDIWQGEGNFGSAGLPVDAINGIVAWLR